MSDSTPAPEPSANAVNVSKAESVKPQPAVTNSQPSSSSEVNSIMINAQKRLSQATGQTIRSKTTSVFDANGEKDVNIGAKKIKKPKPAKSNARKETKNAIGESSSNNSTNSSSTSTPGCNISTAPLQHNNTTNSNALVAPPAPQTITTSNGQQIFIGHNAIGQLTAGLQSGHLVVGPSGNPLGVVAMQNPTQSTAVHYPAIQPARPPSLSTGIARPRPCTPIATHSPNNVTTTQQNNNNNPNNRTYAPPIVINPQSTTFPEKTNTPVGSVISQAMTSSNNTNSNIVQHHVPVSGHAPMSMPEYQLPPPPPPQSTHSLQSNHVQHSNMQYTTTQIRAPQPTPHAVNQPMLARMPIPTSFAPQMQFGGQQIIQTPAGLFACSRPVTVFDDGRGCLFQVVPQGIVGVRLPGPFLQSAIGGGGSFILPNAFPRPLLPAPTPIQPAPVVGPPVIQNSLNVNPPSTPVSQSLPPTSTSSVDSDPPPIIKSEESAAPVDLPPPLMMGASDDTDIRSLFMEEMQGNPMGKTGIISHVLDDFIIQESSEPFAIPPFPFDDCIPQEAFLWGPHSLNGHTLVVPPPTLEMEDRPSFADQLPSYISPMKEVKKEELTSPKSVKSEGTTPLLGTLPTMIEEQPHKECLWCETDMSVFGSYEKKPSFCKKFCYNEYKKKGDNNKVVSEKVAPSGGAKRGRKRKESIESVESLVETSGHVENMQEERLSRRKSKRKNSAEKKDLEEQRTKRRTVAPKRYSDPSSSLVSSEQQHSEELDNEEQHTPVQSVSPNITHSKCSTVEAETSAGYSNSETPASMSDPPITQNIQQHVLPAITSPNLTQPPPVNVMHVPQGDPTQWTMSEVESWLLSQGGSVAQCVCTFTEQEIDGQALMLLTDKHMMTHLMIKLGPAIKINKALADLRRTFGITEPK